MVHRSLLALAIALSIGGVWLPEVASAQRRRGVVVNTDEGAAGRVVTPTQKCTAGVNTAESNAGAFCRPNRHPGAAAVINDNNQPDTAVLVTLPPNYQTVVVAGVTYYTVNGVYYVYDPGRQGYVVVAAPQ